MIVSSRKQTAAPLRLCRSSWQCVLRQCSALFCLASRSSALATLRLGVLILILFVFAANAPAQLTAPASQDPLMQLMLAQPRIDVDSPVTPVASFDPPMVKPGEGSTYRVTINALETAIEWPTKIPASKPLTWREGAHGQILSMAGPLLIPRTTFNFKVHSPEAGQFTIPEFSIKVNGKTVNVPSAQLQVTPNLPTNLPPSQVLLFDLPETSLFVGQTVRARVLLPGSPGGLIQSLGQVQINGQGFIVDQSSAHARIEAISMAIGRRPVNTFVHELLLTPIATGKIVLSAQAYAVGNRVIGGVIIPGAGSPPGMAQPYTLLDSDPVTLQVKPLPPGGNHSGFTGAVGLYSVDPPELSTNIVSVGEPVKVRVRIRGEGNLSRLVPPQPPRLNEWQVFPPTSESSLPQIVQAQGSITFDYTLIPLLDKARNTPALPFSVFNPDRGAYEDLTVPSVAITVLPGNVSPADLQAMVKAQALDHEPEKDPVLSALASTPGLSGNLMPLQKRAWFPLLHLVPATALFALWLWDRRRRFLELHPGIVLRRRARRALRKERRSLARAAQARDGSSFVHSAIKAMTVAVAPHYPAEPRALVGGDVLTLLPEPERQGRPGQTVRRLFSDADAERFAIARVDTARLLDLRPDIEEVLDRLEAKLCD
jgi:hypothetical protein